MIEIKIPKEIKGEETKFMGPFTMRQTISFAIAAILCVGVYKILSPYLAKDIVGFICMLLAAYPIACGWIEPQGMKFEAFTKEILYSVVISPKIRKYKTENSFEENEEIDLKEYNNFISQSRKKKKKNQKTNDTKLHVYK